MRCQLFRIKGLLLVLGVILSYPAVFANHASADALPWPWGTECPFPWNGIEGRWSVRDGGGISQFQFRVVQTFDNGSRLLEVLRYAGPDLVAEGQAIASPKSRVIRAIMNPLSSELDAYWALIRVYPEEGSCRTRRRVTVLTIRPLCAQKTEDQHFILDKIETKAVEEHNSENR